ncbi:hypothetical protein JRC04_23240 [Mycolicibacterium sp. S2-37]|uniref:hypothetical protein n=1 Tax=Mycolicibacterium sp. S2-37 TaxID=2810297 RepID=UPI001A953C01|nr:hypothetical protein [Mycolicibacterium sp. S2-37]MBO0680392.1 hypothetical protein [Mycolicibacterium sp. S2-37]
MADAVAHRGIDTALNPAAPDPTSRQATGVHDPVHDPGQTQGGGDTVVGAGPGGERRTIADQVRSFFAAEPGYRSGNVSSAGPRSFFVYDPIPN